MSALPPTTAVIPAVAVAIEYWKFNRERTIATLSAIEAMPNPMEVLGWRPGPGRSHIAWQIVHIGITEELFATERFFGTTPGFPDLLPRFRHGSVPDDNIPTAREILDILAATRDHLITSLQNVTADQLKTVPPALESRNLTIGRALLTIAWHEAHHQGQAHMTLNSYKKATQG